MRPTIVLVVVLAVVASACTSGVANDSTTTTQAAPDIATTTLAQGTSSTTSSSSTTVAPTTTTTTESTEPGSGIIVTGQIGVVGCSNTTGSVDGYTTLSDADLLTEGGLTGGSLGLWGQPGTNRFARYWGLYDERRPVEGYAATWIQLCIRENEHRGSFDARQEGWIETVVAEIHQRDPDIPIWISGVNTFTEEFLCRTVGTDGPAIAAEAANWAARMIDGVERGPNLGPLQLDEIIPDGKCHPNAAGRLVLGEPLVAFFDGTG